MQTTQPATEISREIWAVVNSISTKGVGLPPMCAMRHYCQHENALNFRPCPTRQQLLSLRAAETVSLC